MPSSAHASWACCPTSFADCSTRGSSAASWTRLETAMFLAGVTLMAGGPLGQQPSGNGPCFSLSGSQNSPRGVLPALRLQSPGDGCLLAMDGRICVGCRCRCVRPIRLGWSPAKARWRLPHNGNGPRGHNFEPPHSFEAKRNREFASEPVGGSTTIAGGFGAAGCTQRDRPFPDADGGLHPSAWFGGLGVTRR